MKKLLVVLGLLVVGFAFLFISSSQPGKAPPAESSARPESSTTGRATAAAPKISGQRVAGAVKQPIASVNPAGTTPAPSRNARVWNPEFLQSLYSRSPGDPIEFELVDGKRAFGVIRYVERKDSQVIHVAGEITSPEKGRFFFQKQTVAGKAGDFAGVVELPGSKTGYRLEPSGPDGAAEMVELPLDQVVCMALPRPDEAALEPEPIPPLDPRDFPDYPIPDYQEGIIPLQSLPGAVGVVYIDYRGGYTPTWGGITYDRPNVNNTQIRTVWERVAEDFIPFNINVTTDLKVYESAPENSRQRCVVTPTTTAAPGAGGVAYLNSWNWTGDTPCWVFMVSGKSCAEAVSHEVGHTLQLGHDGQNPSTEYYGGQGSGEIGWAPIMGVGYYQPVSQWSKGEYQNANNTQDDLARIVGNNNNVDYRVDDTGPVLTTSRYLEIYTNVALAQGVIERASDTDAFQFTTAGGLVSLRANAVTTWGNLAIQATLAYANDTVLATSNPQNTLWASITLNVPAGTYTFRVTGVGRNDPLSNGFSSYGSLGYYSVTGSVANARQPTRFTIPENSPSGMVVGQIPAINPSGNPLVYSLSPNGNTGAAFAISSDGILRVNNAAQLNYETLAQNTQLPVQFELFVNITDLSNSSATELNRRVVVTIADVNEPPTAVAGTGVSVLEHTLPGTLITSIAGADPDFYNLLSYSIVSGDPDGMFSLGVQNGELRVLGDLDRAVRSSYLLQVRISDQVGPIPLMTTSAVNVVVLPNDNNLSPGGIHYTIYTNLSGTAISGLTGASSFPAAPASGKLMSTFEGDPDRGDNYGSVMRGYLIPPYTGSYYFWISSDDSSELWLSTSTNPASISRIAYVSGYTSPREWTKFSTQRSAVRTLNGGQAYYIEARQKEGGGGDHLAVAWSGPSLPGTNIILGRYLAPYEINFVPRIYGFTNNLRRGTFAGARVGRLPVSDANTNDNHTFAILSGNNEGIFSIDNEGWVLVADEAALENTFAPFHNLFVRVTDSGSPPLTATAWAGLRLVESNAVAATSLQREMFYNIGSGTAVNNLLSSSKYPRLPDELLPLSDFSTPEDVANNYGSRVRGYLVPPVSGSYRFFIASDDASQLKLSSTDNPAGAGVIASVSGWTDFNVWTKEAGQTSPVRALVGGQRYYIEALQKEGGGGDHLSVAWLRPDMPGTNVISAAYLEPADLNFPPLFNSQVLGLASAAANGTLAGYVTASDGPFDTLAYKIISGNINNTFVLEPATGALRVVDNTVIANGSVPSFTLTVAVQDSGMGGLYPIQTAQAMVTVSVQPAGAALVWTGGAPAANWADAGNWRGAAPADGDRLIFGLPARQASFNDAVSSLNTVQLTNSGFTLSGSPLSLQSGIANTGDNTWAVPTTLAGPQTWTHSGGGTFVVSGRVENAGNTLNLVANGDLRFTGRISGAGGLYKNGSGRLLLQGAYEFTGPTIVNSAGGTATALEITGPDDLELSNSDLTMNGRMDLWNRNATVGALNGTGMIFANDSTRALIVGANDHSGSFAGILTNRTWSGSAALALVKTGAGTQTLSGANSFSAGTTLRSGQIIAMHATALGTGPVTLGDSGTGTNYVALMAGAAVALNNSLTVAPDGDGSVTIGTPSFNAGGLNMQFNGPLNLQRDVTLQAGSTERTTFAGPVSGPGAITVASPFAAARRVVFDRTSGISNSFSGAVIISTNAWLQLGAGTSIGNRTIPDAAPIEFAPNSRLRLSPAGIGDTETIGALNSISPGAGVIEMVTGTSFTLLMGGGDADGSFSGSIVNTTGSLNLGKVGSGRQVLDGPGGFAGTVMVTGGILCVAHATALGSTAAGTMVAADATLALSNNVILPTEPISLAGHGIGGAGALLNEDGNNTFTGPITLNGDATIGAAAGTLNLTGPWNTFNHDVIFDTAENATMSAASPIDGSGGLAKTGPGRLSLEAANAFTGSTLVTEGVLALGPAAALASTNITVGLNTLLDVAATTNEWVLAAGQALKGNGTISGVTRIEGIVSPGDSLGTLTFSSNLVLAGQTVMELGRFGANLDNDALNCASTLTLGGILTVMNAGPDVLLPGDSFKLFDGADIAPGSFSSVELPPLLAGRMWDLSTLNVDGKLRVVAGTTSPPALGVVFSDGQLTISWPDDTTGYALHVQTNQPGAGLGGTWYPVQGVNSNSLTVPLDPDQGSVFYRLQSP